MRFWLKEGLHRRGHRHRGRAALAPGGGDVGPLFDTGWALVVWAVCGVVWIGLQYGQWHEVENP